ncbi:type II toxin-antitoxin system HigA family antitoxin [Tatumella sp. JGM118]|uniref:Type II toxin-antitoxin system HigA family antitoxin n=1 Tax=Tatumella terrea TaxID=419007 RepID=A0ABW1W318_9GAMM|nr:transcriptional regulator [Tatumella sp. JGM118]
MTYQVKPIRNETDYLNALALIEPLFDSQPEPGTEEGDFMEVMVTLIAAYEDIHYKIAPPTAVEAIKFRMEQQALSVQDVARMIRATSSRVYEILNGTRQLSKAQILALHQQTGIPLESLLSDVQVARDRQRRTATGLTLHA